MINKEHREFLRSEQGRKWIIEKAIEVTPKDKNWQSFHTPYDLCEKMISKTDVKDKSILVLFNVEFLEVLIHKFEALSKNILFLVDCKIESEMASKIYKVDNIIVNDINNIQEVLKKMKTFDLCFSNPPYGKQQPLHLQILKNILLISKEIVYVHPATWILSKKFNKHELFSTIQNKIESITESIEIIESSDVFDTGQQTLGSITHINKNKIIENIDVNYMNIFKYQVKNISEINTLGTNEDWNKYILPFKNILECFIRENSSIRYQKFDVRNQWKHCSTAGMTPNNKYYCTFSTRGYDSSKYMIVDPNNVDSHIISYSDFKDRWIHFWFDSSNEVINFIEYLKTDFCRFCYAVYKSGNDLYNDLGLIPVVDFKQIWSDEKLYSYFNIPQYIRDYISNFLRNKS